MTQTMSEAQALTLGALALDYLLSENGDAPDSNQWARELTAARQVISKMIDRPPASDFFTSAETTRGKSRWRPANARQPPG